ncbi:hypothetical protein WMY93_030033 [Mugilogobius chulae]|uniref:Uncharacterized protein n=1 Tax=Mugilogobius chulae TaxID=88201 RepID=A0AAW0MUJ6_9GOBI
MLPEQSIAKVHGEVHGVTLEECRAALITHNWSIPQAINHLKVEQLFRLGSGPEETVSRCCRAVSGTWREPVLSCWTHTDLTTSREIRRSRLNI